MKEYKRRADHIVRELAGVGDIKAQTLLTEPRARLAIPRVYIGLKEWCTLTGQEIRQSMLEGEAPTAIGETDSGVRVDVMTLADWELRAVARRLREVLSAAKCEAS